MLFGRKRKINKATSEMKAASSKLAKDLAALVPADRQLTKAELDHLESELSLHLAERTRSDWQSMGYPNDLIDMIQPGVLALFRAEFRMSLRTALPLSKLPPAGVA